MTATNSVFVDTNILVYAQIASSAFHSRAVQQVHDFQQQNIHLWVSRQVLREYLAAMNRPNTLAAPISRADLVRDVRLFKQQFLVADDLDSVTDMVLELFAHSFVDEGKSDESVALLWRNGEGGRR